MATAVYQSEWMKNSVYAIFHVEPGQAPVRIADFDSQNRAMDYSRELNTVARERGSSAEYEVRLMARLRPTQEELAALHEQQERDETDLQVLRARQALRACLRREASPREVRRFLAAFDPERHAAEAEEDDDCQEEALTAGERNR